MNEDFVRRMSNRLYAEKAEDESNNTFAMNMSELTEGLGNGDDYEDYESVGTAEFEGESYPSDEDIEKPKPKEAQDKPKEESTPKPQRKPPTLPPREPATPKAAPKAVPKPTPKPKPKPKANESPPKGRVPAFTVDESMSVKKTEAVVKQIMKEAKDQRKESAGLDPFKVKATSKSAAKNNISTGTMLSTVTDRSEESQSTTKTGGKKTGFVQRVMKRRKSEDEEKIEKKSPMEKEPDAPRKQGSTISKSRFTRKRGRRAKKKDPKEVAEKVETIFTENDDEEFEFRNPEVKDTNHIETANYHEMLNYGVQSNVLKATGGVKAVIQKQKEQNFPEAQETDSDVESML